MRSGVYDYFKTSRFQDVFQKDFYRNWIPDELYALGITESPNFQPGEQAQYSNTNSIILALIIERITGNKIKKEIEQRILQPLKLYSTKFSNWRIIK